MLVTVSELKTSVYSILYLFWWIFSKTVLAIRRDRPVSQWTGLGRNSISNSIREIEKFNQGWKYRSAITIYIHQCSVVIVPTSGTTIPFISGKFLWSESCFENNPWAGINIHRDEIWNSISCHLEFFSKCCRGSNRGIELNNFFNLTQKVEEWLQLEL